MEILLDLISIAVVWLVAGAILGFLTALYLRGRNIDK